MAAGTIPKPGSELGPCDGAARCGHGDCAANVRDAQAYCGLCGHQIGYETRFYQSRKPDERITPLIDAAGAEYWLHHADCAERDAERDRKQDERRARRTCAPNLTGAATITPGPGWAYDAMQQDREAGLNQWREVDRAFYWQALEVLPPLLFDGSSFFVGEADSHVPGSGLPVHALFVRIDDSRGPDHARHFARYAVARPNLKHAAMLQLREALNT